MSRSHRDRRPGRDEVPYAADGVTLHGSDPCGLDSESIAAPTARRPHRPATVRAWQDRQAARIECAVVVTAVREDLINEYCAGRRP
jgi:hypothetical protein